MSWCGILVELPETDSPLVIARGETHPLNLAIMTVVLTVLIEMIVVGMKVGIVVVSHGCNGPRSTTHGCDVGVARVCHERVRRGRCGVGMVGVGVGVLLHREGEEARHVVVGGRAGPSPCALCGGRGQTHNTPGFHPHIYPTPHINPTHLFGPLSVSAACPLVNILLVVAVAVAVVAVVVVVVVVVVTGVVWIEAELRRVHES